MPVMPGSPQWYLEQTSKYGKPQRIQGGPEGGVSFQFPTAPKPTSATPVASKPLDFSGFGGGGFTGATGPTTAVPPTAPASDQSAAALAGLQGAGPSQGPAEIVKTGPAYLRQGLGNRTPPSLMALLRQGMY